MKYNTEAYELKEERALSDIHSKGLYFMHKKSGARVCVVSNDDENKVFFIGFRTTPKDSTGVAHIIEHTVLCGSEKFPVKDPFIELLKGSMNTFLNAITYPDKTIYPVASCNDKDFQNLMDVYMDSVLHPNIYKEQNIFKQEGWHYELNAPEEDLKLNGVVYNEMKGAYSSTDEVLQMAICRALYPDITYSKDSGGDPQIIPELTYEDYLDFHRTYYHPCNSYIYLYGDMDVEEKLNWLDKEYLCHYDRIQVDSEIGLQAPFESVRESSCAYNIATTESEENNTYLSLNWSVGTNLDPEQYIAFDLLDHALLGTQGAPIKQALIDAGIGEDIYGGYDSSIYQPMFSVIAKGANPEDQERFVSIIREVLEDQVKNGINRRTLLAAINGYEFKFREADFGRTPKGLMFGIQMLDSWLYDENAPFLLMDELKINEILRKKLDTDYFEQLIQKYLLDNTHAAIVRCVPKKGLLAERDKALQEKLNAYRDSLSSEEIQELIRQTAALEAYQEEPSAPEDLEKIPLLSREDMKKTTDPFSNEEEVVDGVPYIRHDYDTNGIVYLDYMFNVDHIPEEKIPYLAMLRNLLGQMDNDKYSYRDFSDEVNMYTGGIHAEVNCHRILEGNREYTTLFELRMKMLEANLDKALELTKSMALFTDFSDEKRLYEILVRAKSRKQDELSERGNLVALSRAMSYNSKVAKYTDLMTGVGYYDVLADVVDHFEEKKEELRAAMSDLVKEIFQKSNLTVNITAEDSGYQKAKDCADILVSSLCPDTEQQALEITASNKKNEGFMDASQIQYVAMAGNYSESGLQYSGVFNVLKTIMNYDYLWQNVRVKGGAYGAGFSANRFGDVAFYSYRDPNLGKTLETYKNVTEYVRNFDADERDMTKYVIGTFSELDTPLSPISRGRRSMVGKLTGITVERMQKEREDVLGVTVEDIRALEPHLQAAVDAGYICAVGNEEKLKQEEDLFASLRPLI